MRGGMVVVVGVNVTLYPTELSNCIMHASMVARVQWLYTSIHIRTLHAKNISGEESLGGGEWGSEGVMKETCSQDNNKHKHSNHPLTYNRYYKCIYEQRDRERERGDFLEKTNDIRI